VEPAAELPAELVPLAFLLGRWAGVGVGGYPTIDAFRFGQEIVFSHAGKPHLAYTSRTWILDDGGNQVRLAAAETGFWRPQPRAAVEVLLCHPTGYAEVWVGEVDGAKVELRTDLVACTASAKEVSAGHRLYGLVEGELMWAYDMAAVGQPLQPHVSARLRRVPDVAGTADPPA
jgi:hypothetical protein